MDNNQISQLLMVLLIIMIVLLIVMAGILLFLKYRSMKLKQKMEENVNGTKNEPENKKTKTVTYKEYTKQSIFDFMEFEKVIDNMIVQKSGFKYLMVVNCQGVNYDLMSENEKLGVEQGFIQFLNTIRHPIQIYTQTRTVNLENSIENYKRRVKATEEKLNRMKLNYEQMVKSEKYTEEQLQRAYFDLTKQINLYEYGKDIVFNTEQMSLNKNVLNKQYFIIIPYYPDELGPNSFSIEEIENIAFSELYTRSQSIIRTLSACGVNGKIMDSNELVDLLYMAYNRDEAEVFGLDKILKMGYEELYSTAPDVFDKRMAMLNKQIEEEALKLAQSKIYEAKSEKQKRYETKQQSLEDIVDEVAKLILDQNENYVGKDIAVTAKEKIDERTRQRKAQEEGGNENVQKEKTTRGRKKSRAV